MHFDSYVYVLYSFEIYKSESPFFSIGYTFSNLDSFHQLTSLHNTAFIQWSKLIKQVGFYRFGDSAFEIDETLHCWLISFS